MTPRYCHACSTSLLPGSLFCSTCGASQAENAQAVTSMSSQGPLMIGTGRQPAGYMLHQRYRLLHTVGQGGMGAVYVAQDMQLGDRLVAVKEMSMSRLAPQDLPLAIEQFRQEAHLLASLHHPHLPVIHEYFREGDRWYLVMSFIEGQNLQAALNIAPGNRLPINTVVRIGIELCEVLEYLHTHEPQIIFRDLKPANIILTPKGHICLIDFGIARHFKHEQTSDTAYYYSVGYAPPEQYGQSQTSPQSDIYSLGATLHQMLSGHNPASKPFQFPNVQLVDPTLPASLASLISQMLDMDEQARPANVVEIKAQLEQALDSAPIPETVAAKPVPAASKGKDKHKQAPSQQKAAQTGGQPLGFWGRIDTFISQRRQIAWMCFIGLSLILGAILPGLSWFIWTSHDRNPELFPLFVISNATIEGPPYVTIIGGLGVAVVGLFFLRSKKKQPLLEILGSFVLGGIALTNLILSHYNYYNYYGDIYSIYHNYYEYYNIDDYNNYYRYYSPFIFRIAFPAPYYFNISVFLLLFSLWLFVGTRFYLRHANATRGWLWGALLIIGAIALFWPEGIFTLSWLTLLPALLCSVSGIAAIVIALRKGTLLMVE